MVLILKNLFINILKCKTHFTTAYTVVVTLWFDAICLQSKNFQKLSHKLFCIPRMQYKYYYFENTMAVSFE